MASSTKTYDYPETVRVFYSDCSWRPEEWMPTNLLEAAEWLKQLYYESALKAIGKAE